MGIATFDLRRKDVEDHSNALKDLYSRCSVIFEAYELGAPDFNFRYRVLCGELEDGGAYNALVRGETSRDWRFVFIKKPALKAVGSERPTRIAKDR